ncbi:MAG TPA: preprotein translocase subunit SecG, partial [Rubricoccaceae bacterium]
MFTVLVVLILLVAVLMAIVILLQNGKGGGLAGIASGGQTTQILGARQAPDFLEKATWTLGGVFLILCVITTFFVPGSSAGRSILQERASELPAGTPAPGAPGATAPGAPGTSTPGAATAPGSGATPDGAPAGQSAPQATP